MDKTYIDKHLVVDRYVAGDLSAQELDAFEERLAWDGELLAEVELAEKLQDAIRAAPTAEALGSAASRARARVAPLPVAASFLVGALGAALLLQLPGTGTQFDVAGGSPPMDGGASSLVSRTSVVALDVLRSGAAQEVVVRPGTLIVLMVPVDARGGPFRVRVRESGTDREVTVADGLSPGYAESLSIGLPAAALPVGRYILTVERSAGASYETLREFPFTSVIVD